MDISVMFSAIGPLLINLCAILPIFIGAIMLPKRFSASRMLFILACGFLVLSFLNYFLVFFLEVFGTSTSSPDFSSVYLRYSMIFQAFHFAGLLCIGIGIWKLAGRLNEADEDGEDLLSKL